MGIHKPILITHFVKLLLNAAIEATQMDAGRKFYMFDSFEN
jgi:hypothetical protein